LEVLLGRPDGSLGPRYDKATADEALKQLWDSHWLEHSVIERIDHDIRGLFNELKSAKANPFDDLLLYWLDFAQEPQPEQFTEKEVFEALCRAVLKASGASETTELKSDHLTRFRENHQGLKELQESFDKTSVLLIRAAKLASAPLPEGREFKEIERAQRDVLKELDKAEDLILNPDTVTTRLDPRLKHLEDLYIPAYLDELLKLDSLQSELEDCAKGVQSSEEMQALADFSSDVSEAKRLQDHCLEEAKNAPQRLRRCPEDRAVAEIEVKREARVKDIARNEELTFRRLTSECAQRRNALDELAGVAKHVLLGFATFLRSPGIQDRFQEPKAAVPAIAEILDAATHQEAADALVTMPQKDRKALAKQLKAPLGGKSVKNVSIRGFVPGTTVIWEKGDIETVVQEFRQYLEEQWQDGHYFNIER
jgi:hypothetical protein